MGIFDLDAYLLKVLKGRSSSFTGVDTSGLSITDGAIYGLEITSSKPEETMFIGQSVLNNNTNETQTINSDTFTKQLQILSLPPSQLGFQQV